MSVTLYLYEFSPRDFPSKYVLYTTRDTHELNGILSRNSAIMIFEYRGHTLRENLTFYSMDNGEITNILDLIATGISDVLNFFDSVHMDDSCLCAFILSLNDK